MIIDYSLTDFVLRLGWTLMHSTWQFALVGLLMAIALKLSSKYSANLRYLICCCGLASMYAVLVITFGFVAQHSESHVDRQSQSAARATEEILTPMSGEPTDAGDAASVDAHVAPTVARTGGEWGDFAPTKWESLQLAAIPWLPWLVGSWSLGAAALSLWNGGGWFVVHRLRQRGISSIDASFQKRLETLANRLGVSRTVTLAASVLVDAPMVIGWLRPMVLVPASLLVGIPSNQLDAILAHELAHIRRHDYLVNLVQLLTESLLFYHPAVWLISRQIRIEREFCCDDLAIEAIQDRSTYVKALAAVETNRLAPACAVAMSGGGPALSLRRARRILGVRYSASNTGVFSICALALAITAGISAVVCMAQSSPATKCADCFSERLIRRSHSN